MSRAHRKVSALAAVLASLVLPLLLVGPALLPGRLFLPQHPAAFEPLASENPERAALASEGQNLFASDALFPFTTDQRAMRSAIDAGAFPTWDPKLGMGQALAAGSLVSPWFPLNWIELLFGAAGRAWHALLSLVLAGLGMGLFLRARGHTIPAVVYGALAFQAGAFGLINLHYGMKVDAALALPWCLWGVEGVLAGRAYARSGLALALTASLSAGFPAIGIFVATATAAWAFARCACRSYAPQGSSTGGPERRSRARWSLLLPLCLGVLGAALPLLPMAEASRRSERSPRSSEQVAAESLPTAAASTLLLPNLFGGPSDELLAPNNPLAWWLLDESERDRAMIANSLEWNLSPGLATLLLALAGLVGAPRRALLPGLGLLVVLGFAFGWPGSELLYSIPGFNLGAPGRVNAIAWTLWPVLAAVGIDAFVLGRKRALFTVLYFAALTGVLGWRLAATGPPGQLAQKLEAGLAERYSMTTEEVREWLPCERGVRGAQRLQREMRWLARLSLFGAGAALLAGWMARRRSGAALGAWVLVPWASVAGLDATRLAREHLVPRAVPGPLFPSSPAIEAVRSAAGEGRVLRVDRSASGIGEVLELARPNLLRGYGIADLTPYVVFPDRALKAAFVALDPDAAYSAGFSRLSDPKWLGHPLLELAGVTCILSKQPLEHEAWETHFEREGFHVYRRKTALPEPALARIVSADVPLAADEQGQALLDLAVAGWPWEGESSGQGAPAPAVVLSRPTPARLDALVRDNPGDGWLLMLESWAPGWKATVNGRDARVERAFGVARAVRIPPGDCTVRTQYEPTSMRLGALGTLVAALLILLGFRIDRRTA